VIDLDCDILPGVEDGAADLDEAAAIATAILAGCDVDPAREAPGAAR
jgi:hypothetical protein